MAQLGARLNGIEKVVGSSPTRSTQESAVRLAFLNNEKLGTRVVGRPAREIGASVRAFHSVLQERKD